MYGSSAPPPPPMLNGSIPPRRLQTQPQAEMPSCVQNAMMTKDKKPFTYTPGGIDLSQIKSPRMAQRISRNANMEGVTNQPKPSPLAQQNNRNAGAPSAPPPPPSALGMPVPVFPQGAPPPPPVPKQQQLNAPKSPSMARKSPQPQSFEPPPFGFRPEIKIPPNPMAALRKVPAPKPKEVDWSEEFRKERSKSPMPPSMDANETTKPTETQLPEPVREFNVQQNSPDKVDSPVQSFMSRPMPPKENENSFRDQNNNVSNNNYGGNFNQNPNSPQQRVFSPFAASPQPNLPKPLSPVKLNQSQPEENYPIYVRNMRAASEKPPSPLYEPNQSSPVSTFQRQASLEQAKTPIYTRSPRNVSASPQPNQTTFQSNSNDNENYPIYVRSFQRQQPPASSGAPFSSAAPQQQNTQQPLSTAASSFVNDPGRQYYQPNRVTSPPSSQSGTTNGAQMPPWMRRSNSKEIPEWATNADDYNRTNAPQSNNFTNNANYPSNNTTTQYESANFNTGAQKERVVPIQFEKSPIKTPASPGFTAQPYASTPPQYNRVQPPPFAPTASNYATTYNDPHRFVDQGYNNVHNSEISQRVMSPTLKSNDGSRVIPIKLEDGHPYLSGPVSQSPHVIQSDARSTPNQSKSFRVLQQITDTMKTDPQESVALGKPAELHQPHYSRPLGPNDMNEHQLRKMKLNDNVSKNHTYESRFQQQFPDWVPVKPHSVLHSVMRPDNDADVQVLDTDQNDYLNSISHLNNPYSETPYSVSMPSDPSLFSECDDSIHTIEAVPLKKRQNYETHRSNSVNETEPRSRPLSAYSDLVTVPRIVITPTPEDNEHRRASWACYDDSSKKTNEQFETFEMLSSKLSQMYSTNHSLDKNTDDQFNDESKIEKTTTNGAAHMTNGKFLAHSQELDSSQSESDSDSESVSETSSSSSNSEKPSENYEDYKRQRNDSLYEIEDIRDSEMHSDDESADIIEFIIENGDRMSNCDTVEYNDHLSVIFEEDEHSQKRRQKFDSICSSNSSATLANDDNNSKHFDSDDESSSTVESEHEKSDDSETTDNEDDQSTSVTVRLPLRLSFSRSSNDEEITTVLVGKSEIQIDENVSPSKTIAQDDSSPDVSVSFCLRPRSRPVSIALSEQTSIETSDNRSFDNDDDSEVSVSVSLPLRNRTVSPAPLCRPIFTRQQTLSPVPHRRDEFEYKVWNRDFSVERESSIAKSIQPEPNHSNDVEGNEIMSFRDRIAAFESISANKKDELRRQNACTSFDESTEEEDIQFNQHSTRFNQHEYTNQYQTEEFLDHCDNNANTYETKSNYESFITTQCTVNMQTESNPEYIEPQIHFETKQIEHESEESDENEDPEQDFKANQSVQQKIAAFEQPSANQSTKIDARKEITMAREMSNQESIGDRFFAKVAESQPGAQLEIMPQPQSQSVDIDAKPSTEMPINNMRTANYMQRLTGEEFELEETDSGVDIHRRVSEDFDTESECYSELRKLTRYERAATHSRLFRILQEYENETTDTEKPKEEDIMPLSRPKKIVHNVSITRKQNPELVKQAETMAERRERLHLNYNSSSIDTDNPSSSASPSCTSPTPSVNEKLIDELVHSVLQQTKRRNLRNIPVEKIQAAARRALIQQHDENDSCDTFSSFDSTPAITPHEFHDDYYDSDPDRHMDILPSKAFKHLQEQSTNGRRNKVWAARCPRVLSSKTVNSDLSRVTETRESQSPERDHQYAYPY